ncbi:asparagine synthetase B [bacterium]|nr:asparagine synthetase B [bacterium]
MKRYLLLLLIILTFALPVHAAGLLIPMDLGQADHLKAYGVAYHSIKAGAEVEWLLNYRGGSFLIEYYPEIERMARIKGVTIERISDGTAGNIFAEIEEGNMERVKLEKAPEVGVYSPPDTEPWDDAVTMVLEYSEIPYETIYDPEVLSGKLYELDWLHLHHEDFTGQYGKFWANYRNADWYVARKANQEKLAKDLGFEKVSQLKAATVIEIREYVEKGGFLFAMCSATDSYDIAQAAMGLDIVNSVFDGDGVTPGAQSKLNFSSTWAFQNFTLISDPGVYEFSDIDATPLNGYSPRGDEGDYFTLFEFSAKYDPVPTMLTQNHTSVVKGFMGQTTAYYEKFLKPDVIVLGRMEGLEIAKYIHGNYGKGTWTFYGGHDPEDYRHQLGDPPTDLRLHKNSPGYRLILNNILFPAAKKKDQKT